MKFNVNSNELLGMLKIVIKGFDPKDETSFVHLKIEDDKLGVTTRCQSAFFAGSVPITNLEVEDDEPTIYSVDGEVLRNLSGILPKSEIPINFSINGSSRTFVLSYSGNEFKLPILSDTDDIPHPTVSKLGVTQGSEFIDVVSDLLKIVDNDPSAQENPSSCLHITFTEDAIKTMGTDRFAIAEITKPYTGNAEAFEDEEEITVLIKHPQASLMTKAVEQDEVFELVYSDEYIGYIDGEGNTVLVGRTDSNPLRIDPIKNRAGSDEYITIETESLRYALNTIGRLSKNNLLPVKVLINKEEQECNVTSMTGDILAVSCKEWEIEDEREIPFVRTVIQEALIPVSTEYVRLAWTDNGEATMYQLLPVDGDTVEPGIFLGVMAYAG